MTRKIRSSVSPVSDIISKRPRMDVDSVRVVFDAPFEGFEFEEGDDEWIESMGLTELAKIMRSDVYLREWSGECIEFIQSLREVGAGPLLRYRATIRGGEQARTIDFDVKTVAASFGLPHILGGMQLGGVREAQWKDGFDIFEKGEFQSTYSSKKGWCLRNLKPEYVYMKRRFDLLRPMIWFSKQSGYIGNVQAHTIFEISTRREARPDWATGFLKNFVHEILRIRKHAGNFQTHTLIGPVIRRLIHLQLLFDDKENLPPDTEENTGQQVVSTSGRRRSNGGVMEFARPANDLPMQIFSRPLRTPESSRFAHSHLPQGSIISVQSIVSNTQTHGALVPADDLDIPNLDDSFSSEAGNSSPNTSAGNKFNGANDRIGTTAHGQMAATNQNSVNDGMNASVISDYQKSRSAEEAKTQRLQAMEKELILVRRALMGNVGKREDYIRGVQFLARKFVSVGWLSLKQSHDRHDEHLKWTLKALNYIFRLNNKHNPLIASEDLDVYRDVPGEKLWESIVSLSSKGFHHKGSKAVAELSWHLIRHADHNNLLKIVADSRALGSILEILRSSYSCLKSKLHALKSLKSLTKRFDCAKRLLEFPGMTEVLVMLMATDEDVRLHSKAITLLASLIDLSSTTCQLVVRLPSFWDALSDAIFMAEFELGPILRLVESISRASHQCRVILGTLPGVMEVLVHGSIQTLSTEILSNLSAAEENREIFAAFPNLVAKLNLLCAEANHPHCLLISLVHTITLLDTAKFSGLLFSDAVAHYGHFGRGAALLQLKHYHSAIKDLGKARKHESHGLPPKKNEAHLCRAFARTMLMDFEGALDELKMINAHSIEFSLDWEKSVVLCLKCDFKRALVESEKLVLEGKRSDTLFKRDRNYWKHRAYAHFLLGDEVQSRKDAEEALKARPTAVYDPKYWSCPQLSRLPLEYMALAHITTLVLTMHSTGTEAAGSCTIIDTTRRMGWGLSDKCSYLEKLVPCLLRISNYSSLSEAITNGSLKVPDADIRSLSVAHLRELKCSITSSLEDVLGVSACGDPTHICSLLAGLDKDSEQGNARLLHHDDISRPKSHPPVETVRQELALNGGGRGITIIMKAVGKTLPGKLARTDDRNLESEIYNILQDLVAILNRDPDIFPHVHTQALKCLIHLLDRQFRRGLSKKEHVRDNRNLIEHCSNCLDRVVQLSKLDTNRMVRDSAQALLGKLSSNVDT